MAIDKLVDSTQLDSDLTSVANAIRTKGGTSGSLSFPSGFVSAIDDIPTGGGGGGVGIFEKMEVKSLTISGITNPDYIPANISFSVNHSLGEVPDFILIYPKARYIPTSDTGGSNIRVFQYAYYFGIGNRLVDGAYGIDSNVFCRLYTNNSNAKYEQFESTANASKIINNITNNSIGILGVALTNAGIRNGDYWVVIGKIANTYNQGNQVVIN